MKKTIFLLLSTTALFANNNGYVPFSQFSDNQKVEYNFETLQVPQKQNNSFEKVEIKKELEPKVIKANEIKTKKDTLNEEQSLKKEIVEKKVESFTEEKEIITKVNEKTIVEDIKKPKVEILSNSVKLENESSGTTNDLKVNLKFEYSPMNVKYSMNSGNVKTSPDSFSPIISLQTDKHIIELDYFMTDALLETKWYKIKYKNKYSKNLNLGFGVNRYDISVDNSSAREDYLSLEVDHTKNYNKRFFVNYGGSYGMNSDIQAYEYFLSLGLKNQEIYNSSYLLGYKSKIIKDDNLDITYSGPFIGVNTTF